MKHIKLFEAYPDPTNNILCDVEDVCLELKDIGFIIDVVKNTYKGLLDYGTHYKSNTYTLSIYKPEPESDWRKRSFLYKDVKDVIDRIVNYIYVNSVKIQFKSGIRHTYRVNNKKVIIDKSSIRNKIDMIKIEFELRHN